MATNFCYMEDVHIDLLSEQECGQLMGGFVVMEGGDVSETSLYNGNCGSESGFVNSNCAVEEVHLALFGGEPFLAAKKVTIPISQEITRICKETGKRISLHFTTNGTLLKSEYVSQIANLHVPTSFQIAFDGDRDLHNKTKKWGH